MKVILFTDLLVPLLSERIQRKITVQHFYHSIFNEPSSFEKHSINTDRAGASAKVSGYLSKVKFVKAEPNFSIHIRIFKQLSICWRDLS